MVGTNFTNGVIFIRKKKHIRLFPAFYDVLLSNKKTSAGALFRRMSRKVGSAQRHRAAYCSYECRQHDYYSQNEYHPFKVLIRHFPPPARLSRR